MRVPIAPALAVFTFTVTAFAQTNNARFAQFQPEDAGAFIRDRTGMEGIELVGGYGEQTDNFRLTANWYLFSRTWRQHRIDFSLAANYSVFDGEAEGEAPEPRMTDVGLTPTATLYFNPNRWGLQPFIEAGIGFHYLSGKRFTNKEFSTNFQFGDHIGVGVRFGEDRRMRVAYQFQHLSNAGIGNPNPGINFHLLSYGVRL